jgi:hypothetical protein
MIVLVTDNEHYTQQKRLIFSPPKPPFRCKVTPSTLHSLYMAGGVPGGVRGGGNNVGAGLVAKFRQARENCRRGAVQALPQSRRGRFLSRFSPCFDGAIWVVFRPVLELPHGWRIVVPGLGRRFPCPHGIERLPFANVRYLSACRPNPVA